MTNRVTPERFAVLFDELYFGGDPMNRDDGYKTREAHIEALAAAIEETFRKICEANRRAWTDKPMWIEGGAIIAAEFGGAPRYETLHHPDGSSVRVMMGAGGGGSGSFQSGAASGGTGAGASRFPVGAASGGGTPTPMLPPRPEPKAPTPGTPCYRCGVQAVLFRHGVPECAPGHAKKYKTPGKST